MASMCAIWAPCWQALSPVPVASNRARSPGEPWRRRTVGAARASSQSQASVTGRSPASTSQVPSPCAVTPTAAVRRARPSTLAPRSRSALAQSSQVRGSDCRADPSGPVS